MTSTQILYTEFEIYIPYSQSLKQKRQIINRVRDRIHNQFNVSIAEVAFLDEWQRAGMALVMVGNARPPLEKRLSDIEQYCIERIDAELMWLNREWL
ncbi:DUF503 domain-containing protein [Ketobacter sp. MCCC 1A13808]|uniref:DUF503 domain-containing protein n=1 Tax=Ketobacter sp. MCCC 1A13808 TaxID=2602738 RepID=UPI000F26B777|nr:DUF503 domain-containing protein [Ketobacter sp. MCCC 1A13808]MVF12902.1 DUF503 domain-containing protein [Ketobacter sp. MCCC 1A13808]RLP54429.1 MAG: DUF503 domain-containing protein [Ketobacter sp.]